MTVYADLAAFTEHVGTHLGYSDWHLVDQAQIDLFAEATGDRQWIHVDPEAALKGPFGATVAHGFLTLSLLPVLTADIWQINGLSMGINYGCNKVRFPSVVRVGDRVRAGAELISAAVTAAGTQVTVAATIEIDGATKPACVAEWVLLLAG